MNDEHSGRTIDRVTEARIVQEIVASVASFATESQVRILQAALTILGHDQVLLVQQDRREHVARATGGGSRSYPPFSEDTSMSPKQFLLGKQPHSDVERIACLAYYLTHFLEMPHFKTVDLSKLNTEAAQPRFSNAANAANNAVKQGYLVQATKGYRQLSAAGEQFVRSLPDREAARAAMAASKPRRKTPKSTTRRSAPSQ